MSTTILNMTQHVATADQVQAGVVEPENKKIILDLITFESLPTMSEIEERATKLASIAQESGSTKVMIGGAPYLMPPLEKALMAVGLFPVYAFSKRVSEDTITPTGEVKKVSVFKHAGFIEVR